MTQSDAPNRNARDKAPDTRPRETGNDEDLPGADSVPPSWVAWAVTSVSALLVLAMVGFMIYRALAEPRPPSFGIEVVEDDVREVDGVFITPVEVTNEGTSGVGELHFEARQGERVYPMELTVLGPGEVRRVAFWLTEDPARVPLELVVVSHLE